MTMRTKTLTAVAALSIFAGGYALAQDGSTTAPVEENAETEATTTPPATENSSEAAGNGAAEEQAEEPAPAGQAEQPEATEEPVAEEAPADGVATEEQTAAEAEAPAEDTATAEEPAAAATEEPAAAEASAEDAAVEEQTEEPAADAAATEEPAAAEEAPAEEHAEESANHGEEGGDNSHSTGHIEDIAFSFEGPFGKYDQHQLQRGLQVYTEVCSACHGMKFVPIRTLHDEGGPGLPEDQVRAYAGNLTIIDAETEEERPREPTDHFPTVSGEGMGPDLSLMAKSRAGFHGPIGTGINQLIKGTGGPEYIHAILTGYTGEEKEQAGTVLYENSAFDSGFIGMPPPLSDDLVTYEDGTPATVDQMARDVSAFLMWTAEPKMMARKQVGLVAVLFLIVLTGLLYMTNKKLWAPHKGKKD